MPIWDRGSYSKPKTTTTTKTTKPTTSKPPSYSSNFRQADQKTISQQKAITPSIKPSYNNGSFRQADQKTISQQKTIQTSKSTPTTNFRQADQKTIAQASVSRSSGKSSGSSTPKGVNPTWAANNPTLNKVLNTISAPLRNFQENTNVGRKAVQITRDYIAPMVMPGAGGAAKGLVPQFSRATNLAKRVPQIEQAAPVAQKTAFKVPQIVQRGGNIVRQEVGLGVQGAKQTVNAFRSLPTPAKVALGGAGVAGAAGGGLYKMTGPWGGQAGTGGNNETTITPTNVDPNTQNSLTSQNNGNQGGGGYYGGSPGYGGGGVTPAPNNSMTPNTGTNLGWLPGANNMMPAQEVPFEQVPRMPIEELPPEMPVEMPDFMAEYQQMMNAIQQAQQQNSALAATYLNQFTTYLDQMETQIRQQFEAQGQGIDPATQAALAQIRQEVGLRRQGLMEEMNRRGLLQSGVWLEMENRILNNQLTSEEQLLAGRLSDMQNRMTDALMGLANQRLNAMGQFAQNSMQSQQAFNNMQVQAMQQMQGRQDQWNQWWAQQAESRRQQQQEQSRWNYEQQWNRDKQIADWTGTIPQGYPGAGQQTMDAKKSLTTGTNNSLTNQYIQQVTTYGNLQDAIAEFQRYRPVMEQQGVNTQAVLNAIYGYFGQ